MVDNNDDGSKPLLSPPSPPRRPICQSTTEEDGVDRRPRPSIIRQQRSRQQQLRQQNLQEQQQQQQQQMPPDDDKKSTTKLRGKKGRRYIHKKVLVLFCSVIVFGILSHLKLTRRTYLHRSFLSSPLSPSLSETDDAVAERLMIGLVGTTNNSNKYSHTSNYSTSQTVHAKVTAAAIPAITNPTTTTTTFVNNSRRSSQKKRWAYAFLLAGCNVEEPEAYHGFLAGIVVTVRKLQQFGSQASFVVMIQMSTSSSSSSERIPFPQDEQQQLTRDQQTNSSHHLHSYRPRLPVEEEELLQRLNIQVVYLPIMRSHVHECFYATVQEKFRILTLTQFDRVIFVDADIMPKCNLDYLFELSSLPLPSPSSSISPSTSLRNQKKLGLASTTNRTNRSNDSTQLNIITQGTPTMSRIISPALKGTVILSWQNEASNAGFFMVTPSMDDWNLLQQAIVRHEQQVLKMDYPYWDEDVGWGHRITPPDYWRGMKDPTTKNHKWKWFSVHSDQGLLYYFAKYIKKDVSIIIGDEIETWSTGTTRKHASTGDDSTAQQQQQQQPVQLQNIQSNLFDRFSCKLGRGGNRNRLPPPYSDLHHFTGTNKPWESENIRSMNNNTKPLRGNVVDWTKTMLEIQDMTNFTFQFALSDEAPMIGSSSKSKNSTSNMKNNRKNNPPVGRFAGSYEMFRHIRAKSFFGWKGHYDEKNDDVYYLKN